MDIAELYGANVDLYEAWFRENELTFASEVEAIRQLLPEDVSGAIELGVGSGLFASQLGITQGLEPSAGMAALATARGIHVTPGRAEALPFEAESFPLALMITVDCYLPDLPAALREVRRILTPDGAFIIAFIDRDTELGRLYNANKAEQLFYRDANFHSRDEIRIALETTGFAITDERQTVYSFANIAHAVRPGLGEGVFGVIRARKMRP